ncbi:SusC/RagA family TonB-linked outer membrane protein [Flavobacterium oreochromis]|uniref:SusC/RagA family TonB-linked outer membrane protein n=1 Tax=Flavobacterium oreochromis TaxID=2906078 RepID=UPI00385C16D9
MRSKFKWIYTLLIVLTVQFSFAQEKTITGVVTDSSGPLPGVNILVKGTQRGVSTGFDGKYIIKAKEGETLIFSFMGMPDANRIIGASNTINVLMNEGSKQLGEVVVTALGVKKSSKTLAYSAQNIKSEEISKSGRANLLDGLNGKVSGVQITNSGGQAGSGTNVVIRGYSSITGNNQPLYVIDGIPIDNSSENTDPSSPLGGTPTTNRASDISPDDIESVSILKGGAASALYGIRAANGVVMITTKKGKNGKNLNIEFATNISTEEANKFPSLSDKFTTGNNGIFNSATTNQWGPLSDAGALYPAGTKRDIDGNGTIDNIEGTPIKVYKDNYKNFFRKGLTLKHNVNVSGGSDKNTYFASISNLQQEGIIQNQNYKRTSFLASATQKFNEKFDMEAKSNYINSSGKFFNNNQLSQNLGYFNNNYDIANYPYQDQFGNKTYWHRNLSNPMWTVNKTGEDRNIDRLIGNLGFNYKIIPNLILTYKVGLDTYKETRRNINSIGTAEFVNTDYLGDIRETRINNIDINSDLFLRYNTSLSEDIKLSAMIGNNFYHKEFDNLSTRGNSFLVENLFDITNTKEKFIIHRSYKKELMGFFGELTTSYKNILHLTLTGRRDKASTLPKNNNTFFYPSMSGSFIFSELMNNKSFFGKIRGSYAKIANIPDPNSLRTTFIKQESNYFELPAFSYANTELNENLKPEKITQWEVGTELGFWDNRVNLEVNYYTKKSEDQIVSTPVSNATGVYDQTKNIGEIENRGIEATLRFNDILKESSVKINSEFNFTHNKGKVLKVGDNISQVALGYAYWGTSEIIAKEGEALGAIYGYTYEHIDPSNPNSPLLVDETGTPKRSASKSIIGNINPDFIIGWNTSISYKGWKAGFLLERKQGGKIVNDYANQMVYTGHSSITDRRNYTGSTTINDTQFFNGVDTNGKPVTQSAPLTKLFYTGIYGTVDQNFVEDASWWRLRNVYIGYALPKKFTEKLRISDFELTFSARNLWLKTNYSGVDPEVNSLGTGSNGNGVIGIDSNSIPNTKSFDFGVKFKI